MGQPMHALVQALAGLTQTATAQKSCNSNQFRVCIAELLWHSAEQQRDFGALTSSIPPAISRETGVTVPTARSAQLPRTSWQALHTLPPAAAPRDDPGHFCQNHDHHHHHHQPSLQTKPASPTVGQ